MRPQVSTVSVCDHWSDCVCSPGCDNAESERQQRSEVWMFAQLANWMASLSSRPKKKKAAKCLRAENKTRVTRNKGPYLAVSSPPLFPSILPNLPHFPCLITLISAISFQRRRQEQRKSLQVRAAAQSLSSSRPFRCRQLTGANYAQVTR